MKSKRCFLTTSFVVLCTLVFGQSHQASSPLGQYVQQASEFSSRARANIYFPNTQSIFKGVQVSSVNVGQGNLTFLRRDMIAAGRMPIVLARVYDSDSPGSAELGVGWRFSAAESITVESGRAHLLTESGSVIDFVTSDGKTFQLEKDHPSDYSALILSAPDTFDASLRTGFQKEFKFLAGEFRLTKVTDRNGNSLRLSYQGSVLVKLENANHWISLTFDKSGHIVLAKDDQQRKVIYSYDGEGRLTEVDDLGGQAWHYGYQGDGRLTTAIDPMQRVNLSVSFDESGRVQRLQLPSGVIQYSYDPSSGLTTVIDRKKLTSRFFQNTEGITTSVVNALGEQTSIGLDSSRNVITLARNGSVIETMSYDQQHRLVSRHSASDSGIVDRQYTYDPGSGELNGIQPSTGDSQAFNYDPSGNLIDASLAGGQHEFRYSPSGDLTMFATGTSKLSFTPDADGLFASITDQTKAQTAMQYKAGGELAAAQFPNHTEAIFEYQPSGLRSKMLYKDGRRVEYSYDPAGNLTGTKVFNSKGKQTNGQTLEMNDSYQLTRWVLFDGTETVFRYDPNGNLRDIKKGKALTRFEYDALDRLTTVITPQGQRLTYSYKPGERSLIEQYEHASILVSDLRDTGFTFSTSFSASASRPLTATLGSVRFSESLGTFQLANANGSEIVRPHEMVEGALEQLRLYAPDLSRKALLSGFTAPFNNMFIPSEYLTINCCPECYYDGDEWYCPPCSGDGGSNAPSLNSITPSSAAANAGNVPVVLAGGFNDASETISISGSGITISPNPASVDGNGNVNTVFALGSSVAVGSYDVSVSDSGGTSNSVTFAVTPAITGISPSKGLIGASNSVTISGAGFASGATVNAGPNVSVSNLSVSSSTQITADFTPNNSAAGSQSVTVTVNGQTSNSVNFFVQVPTSLLFLGASVLPDGTAPPAGCLPSLPYGIMADLQYQVLDQSGTAIASAAMTPHEKGTLFTGSAFDNNIGPVAGYPTSSATTDGNGTFHDVPFGYCQNLPIANPGKTSTQTITMIRPDGVSSQVRSQTWTVTAPGTASFEHGTLTNGSDITVKR